MAARLALLIALLVPTAAAAALSGYYDSLEKIGTILASGVVADQLGPVPVRSVENTGTAADGSEEWTIRTQDCDLVVKLIAQLPEDGMVGKTTYLVEPVTTCD